MKMAPSNEPRIFAILQWVKTATYVASGVQHISMVFSSFLFKGRGLTAGLDFQLEVLLANTSHFLVCHHKVNINMLTF